MYKKILFGILLIFIGVLKVQAVTINETMTCDAEDQTVDRFSYPETKVFENSLCTIKCSEELIYAVDPIKRVLAGMGFSYPLYVSGEKKCTATYDYNSFYTNLQNLVNSRDDTSDPSLKQNYINQITNKLSEKQECDDYYKKDNDGEYIIDADVTLTVETSGAADIVDYEYFEIGEYEIVETIEEVPYSACELDNGTDSCTYSTKTVSKWESIDRNDGVYTIGEMYIEAYTGNIINTSTNPNDCKTCNTYFVSFYEKTRPEASIVGDKGYTLTLKADKLGNNVIATGDVWNLNVNCWYEVENLMFPQSTDVNYVEYGETGFMYRLIELETPFPKREPGHNWFGNTSLIDTKVKDNVMYEINLTRSAISLIRQDNLLNPNAYSIFDYDINGVNSFIEKYIGIITRKYSGD